MKPNINIHNYEEYFLLYADGELSVEEKVAVESFVKEHPVLQPALDALLQTRLKADDNMIFSDKNLLFKKDEACITLNNCEEYFLLYVDDELSSEQKNEVEKFVLQHPALQSKFTLLKQTHLPNETVEFADKEYLYKKEIVTKPIVLISWKRFAVAASVAGLIFATWFFYSKKSNIVEQATIVANNKSQVEKSDTEVTIHQSLNIKQNNSDENIDRKKVAVVVHLQKNNQTQKLISTSNVDVTNAVVSDKNDLIVADEPRINAGEIAIIQNNRTIQPVRMIKQLPDNRVMVNAGIKMMAKEKEIKSSNEENDSALYVANIRIDKNKIPNILKRVSSILHFNGNEDNGIAIANFSISR